MTELKGKRRGKFYEFETFPVAGNVKLIQTLAIVIRQTGGGGGGKREIQSKNIAFFLT